MFEPHILQAVENYLVMERDAKIIDMMRKGIIKRIERLDDQWRVDTDVTFYCAETLEEAILKATNV